jgi:hypothetical protein
MDDEISALVVHRPACPVERIVSGVEDADRLPRAVWDNGPLAIVKNDVLVWGTVTGLRILVV